MWFLIGFSKLTPPVRKNIHSSGSISPDKLTAIINDSNNLSCKSSRNRLPSANFKFAGNFRTVAGGTRTNLNDSRREKRNVNFAVSPIGFLRPTRDWYENVGTRHRSQRRPRTFSNRLRQTLTYNEYVKYFISSAVRSLIFVRFGLFRMDITNKSMNHASEYWYVGSILANVSMVKNNLVECAETTRYRCLVLSIDCSVTCDSACFFCISSDNTFDELKTFTAFSSSRMSPSDELSTSNILSSISFKDLQRTNHHHHHPPYPDNFRRRPKFV